MEQPPFGWMETPTGPPLADTTTHVVPAASPEPMPPRRWRAVAVAAGGLLVVGGGVAVAASAGGSTPISLAASRTATTTVPESGQSGQKALERLQATLQPLVDNGTITTSQRDAVIKALQDARKDAPHRDGGQGGFGMKGGSLRGGAGGLGMFRADLDTAAKAIGVTAEDLKASLRSGSSIADVATSKGVSVDAVIGAVVASVKAQIAAHPDGPGSKLTEDQITERVTQAVNAKLPDFKKGLGGGHHGGEPGPDASPVDPSVTTTTVN